jgi:hypothetical protein
MNAFRYQLIDSKTGQVVDTYSELRVACTAADIRGRQCGEPRRFTVMAVTA